MKNNFFVTFISAVATLSVASTAQAATIFTSFIDSTQVVAGSTSTATGTATITLDTTIPDSPFLNYSITLNGLKLQSEGGTVTKVHFHLGQRGTASPFHVFNIYDPIWGNDSDLVVTNPDSSSSTFTGTWTDDDVTGIVDTAYLSNPDFTKPLSLYVDELLDDLIYINIHTSTYPTGEIRGQIEVVPEPLTLLGTATAIGLGTAFKQKKGKRHTN